MTVRVPYTASRLLLILGTVGTRVVVAIQIADAD